MSALLKGNGISRDNIFGYKSSCVRKLNNFSHYDIREVEEWYANFLKTLQQMLHEICRSILFDHVVYFVLNMFISVGSRVREGPHRERERERCKEKEQGRERVGKKDREL